MLKASFWASWGRRGCLHCIRAVIIEGINGGHRVEKLRAERKRAGIGMDWKNAILDTGIAHYRFGSLLALALLIGIIAERKMRVLSLRHS